MKKKCAPKYKALTNKSVQSMEDKPFELPNVTVKPEVDTDPWDDNGLTIRQQLFVRYYLGEAGGCAVVAAQLAGYGADNWASLRVMACNTLHLPNVQRLLERERGRLFGSLDDVRNSIAAIASGNFADCLRRGEDGKLRVDLEAAAEAGSLGLIQQVEEEIIEDGQTFKVIRRKVKLYDRLRALEILAKINGQLTEKHEVHGTIKHTHDIKPAMAKLLGNPEAVMAARALAERMKSLNDN